MPATVAAIFDLHTTLSQPFGGICLVVSYALLVTAILSGMAVVVPRWAAPIVSSWVASGVSLAHRRQAEAARRARHDSEYMRHGPQQLGVSVYEFAHRAGLSLIEAWAIMRNPELIPRPDLWRSIEKALLLPAGFFERGYATGEGASR